MPESRLEPAAVGAALLWLIVWFLLGYLLYALLFGGFAALVSRQEEIGSVTTPLMFLLFVPFYVTMFLVPNDPDSTLVRVLSQVPFFAPFSGANPMRTNNPVLFTVRASYGEEREKMLLKLSRSTLELNLSLKWSTNPWE